MQEVVQPHVCVDHRSTQSRDDIATVHDTIYGGCGLVRRWDVARAAGPSSTDMHYLWRSRAYKRVRVTKMDVGAYPSCSDLYHVT